MTILDVFPIAADGGKENGCFPATSATAFFGNGDKGLGYIPAMLNALVKPSKANNTTIPVIVFGKEAIGVWSSIYVAVPAEAGPANCLRQRSSSSARRVAT